MTANSNFFKSKQGAAILKHQILDKYLVPFVSKTGQRAPGNRVVVLDGYAGPGLYEDGSEASPALLCRKARELADMPRNLEVVLVERDAGYHSRLMENLQGETFVTPPICGPVEENLGVALQRAEGVPLLAFLDPYGTGLSFDDTMRILNRATGVWAPPTELLMNFSTTALGRFGGLLVKRPDAPATEATCARMDAFCGGPWWRDVYQRQGLSGRAALEAVVTQYAQRVAQSTGCAYWVVDVYDKPSSLAYYLVFFTRHGHGAWEFGECLSLAQEAWRHHVRTDDDVLFTFEDDEERLAAEWVTEIKANIAQALYGGRSLNVMTDLAAVMGSTLGLAREKHLRKAVKELHAEGITAHTGKGKLRDAVLRLPTPSA